MRSPCRSDRGGKAVTPRSTRTARTEITRIAALAVTLGAGSACTQTGASQDSKSGETPAQSADSTTWYARVLPHKPASVDDAAPQGQPDAGGAVSVTPTIPVVGSVPSVDVGPSEPPSVVPVAPPVVVPADPPAVVVPKATLVFNESLSTHSASPSQVFSVQSVRELFIHSVWSDLTGEHTETRKFYSPSGELYYEKLTPFSTVIDAPVPFEREVSLPHASSIQATPLDADGHVIVSDYLSVGGTWISDRAMTGIWTVEIYLDDATSPSVRSDLELVP